MRQASANSMGRESIDELCIAVESESIFTGDWCCIVVQGRAGSLNVGRGAFLECFWFYSLHVKGRLTAWWIRVKKLTKGARHAGA